MKTPQVLITLSPQGDLQMELPGFGPTRRVVPLSGKIEETLKRVLGSQLENKVEIGEDGAPTQQQVRHWEQHSIFANSSCRFCLTEGRIKPQKIKRLKQVIVNNSSVKITRLAPKGKAKPRKTSDLTGTTEKMTEEELLTLLGI